MSALARFKSQSRPALQIMKPADTVLVNGTPFSRKQIKALERAGVDMGLDDGTQEQYKDNPSATATVNANVLNGPSPVNSNQWGLLTQPGVRPQRFAVVPRPMSVTRLILEGGLTKNEYYNEILEILTGITAAGGTNSTGWCADPPVAGQLKTMARIFKYGRLHVKTRLNALPDIGRLVNRVDVPGQILNAGPEANPLIPDIMYGLNDTRSQLKYELYTLGNAIEQSLEKVNINGNNALASTATNWGWIQEFLGLDAQIATGFTDAFAVPSVTANAVDSISENWASALVGGTQASTGRNIVQLVEDIYRGLKLRAASVGMEGFELAIVMRPEFFLALVDNYACSYATARCVNTNAGQPQSVDQTAINNLRLEMIDNQYLLIEGIQVPVVFSQGITLTQVANNQYSNSFYFVPYRWNGRPLLRMDYFPVDNQYLQEFANFLGGDRNKVLNNGLYLVGMEATALCREYHFASLMRIVLETPFLAARVDNIQYTYNVKSYSPYAGETGLYVNGGVSYRTPYYAGY